MKTLAVALLALVLFSSCDPNADKTVGRPQFKDATADNGSGTGSGGGGGTGAGNNTTDAPLDGGLSILLLAGTAYGIRRARNKKNNPTD